LFTIDDETNHPKPPMDNLAAQPEQLNGFFTAHRAVVTPIHHLPSELLSEIFLQCFEAVLPLGPFQCAAVCTRWRVIALSTPRL
ncbi:hypothetical protein B0H10DRAFT_1733648, partial [Mycena sp. CBHHK59/15]